MFGQIWSRRDASSFGYSTTNHVSMTLVTPPASEPVTLTQFKAQARIPYDAEDDVLSLYMSAARETLEKYLRRALITQTWDFRLDWGPAWIELPWPILQSVTGVYTTGLDNVETVVPTSAYVVDTEHNFVGLNIGNVWPLHRGKAGFRVRYVAGYGDAAANVPATLRRAILALATQMDANRDAVVSVSDDLAASLAPYRVEGQPYRFARGMSREDLLA
jgi:uncharacterized phiE125 gp8 family phage protein